MFDVGGAEVTQNLGGVFVGESADGFEFNDELVVDHEVGEEVSEQATVFVEDLDGVLLIDFESLFAEAVA